MAKKRLLDRVLPGYEFYAESAEPLETASEKTFFEMKLQYAEVLVSLWSHSCAADGVFHKQEVDMIGRMIAAFFEEGSIFDDYVENREDIVKELLLTFDHPLPIKTISEFIGDNNIMATNMYEDAVCIVCADGKLTSEEREYLDDLAIELSISHIDKKGIEKRYTV
jgi:tellurite resistance protein